MDKLMIGTIAVLFILMVVFLIMYLVQKARYERRFMPDEEFFSDENDYE